MKASCCLQDIQKFNQLQAKINQFQDNILIKNKIIIMQIFAKKIENFNNWIFDINIFFENVFQWEIWSKRNKRFEWIHVNRL